MAPKIHFISGLPRAGSTLLAAILRQNPRFHAGMTSPVGAIFSAMLGQFSAGSEYGPVIDQATRRRMLRGVFENFYAEERHRGVIFDTNRLWCSKLPALMDLYPEAKVIACVRNVAWVMDSIEKLYRSNPFENTKLFNDDGERATVYSRVETLARNNRLVGFAWSSLKEAYYSAQAGSLLLVDYELLAETPEKVLRLIYEFLGEPWFEHDFNQLNYDAPAFDQALGMDGLHRVRPQVSVKKRASILPPDLFSQYARLSFWNEDHASAAHVIRVKNPAAPSASPAQRNHDIPNDTNAISTAI